MFLSAGTVLSLPAPRFGCAAGPLPPGRRASLEPPKRRQLSEVPAASAARLGARAASPPGRVAPLGAAASRCKEDAPPPRSASRTRPACSLNEEDGADDGCDLLKKRVPCSPRIVAGLAARPDGDKLSRVGTTGTLPVMICPPRKSLTETPAARWPVPRPNSSARTEVTPRSTRGSRSAIRKLENRSSNRPASGRNAPGKRPPNSRAPKKVRS